MLLWCGAGCGEQAEVISKQAAAKMSHKHVIALQEKKQSLLSDLQELNSHIQRLKDNLAQSPEKQGTAANSNTTTTNKQRVEKISLPELSTRTKGFAPRNALLHELRHRVSKGWRWQLKSTPELTMWKDQNMKQTSAFEMATRRSGSVLATHEIVNIFGGGNNHAAFCIPMNSSEYTFRHLMQDLNNLWDLPAQTLAPYFQLVANADPYEDQLYDFVPHRFDPDALVKGSLLDLQRDPDRGFGTQTGVPGSSLPPLHCRPIVSGDTIDALVSASLGDQRTFFNSLAMNKDASDSLIASAGSSASVVSHVVSVSAPVPELEWLSQEQFDHHFLPQLALGKDHEETAAIYKVGRTLFAAWSDKATDDVTGKTELRLTFEAFCWLLEQWGDKKIIQKELTESMSAKKAWKVFDKPTRFVAGGTTTVRFDEFATAIRLHNPNITTAKLHLLFDKMDSDRGGSVTFEEFYAFWSTLKLDLFDSVHNADNTTEMARVKDRAKECLAFTAPFLFGSQDENETASKSKMSATRDVTGYSLLYLLFIVLVLWRRSVLPEFNFVNVLQEKIEANGRYGALSHLTYSSVSSRDDLWEWLQGPMSDIFVYSQDGVEYSQLLEDTNSMNNVAGIYKKVLGNNELMSSTLRLRQLRVTGRKCSEQVSLRSPDKLCYPEYASNTKNIETIVPANGGSFISGSTWTNPLVANSAFSRLTERTTGGIVTGIDVYDSTGYVVDLVTNASQWKATLTNLRNGQWLSKEQTRALIVQFVVYNPTVYAFVQIDFLVELFPDGGMSLSSSYRPMVFDLYTTVGEQILLLLEFLIFVGAGIKFVHDLLLLLLRCCVLQCGGLRCRCCCKKKLPSDDEVSQSDALSTSNFNTRAVSTFVLLVDLSLCIAILAAGIARMLFYFSSLREVVAKQVGTSINQADLTKFIDLSGSAWYNEFGYTADGFIALLLPIKITTTVNKMANCRRTKLFSNVLIVASEHISSVFALYVVVLFVYSALGHYLFSPYVRGYASYQHTVMTLVMMSVGHFDYETLDAVNSATAFVYVFSFVIIMLLLISKLFTAIVNHEYSKLAQLARRDE